MCPILFQMARNTAKENEQEILENFLKEIFDEIIVI